MGQSYPVMMQIHNFSLLSYRNSTPIGQELQSSYSYNA